MSAEPAPPAPGKAAPDARSQKLRLIARRAGQAITVAALIFLAWEMRRQWGRVSDWRPTPLQIAMLAGLCLLHGGALFLQARNWLTLVTSLVAARPPAGAVLRSFTETQIAKYVPGNVMHFVGRHMYLKGYGVAHKPIVFATLLEIAGLPVAAVTAICFLVPFADLSGVGYGAADIAPFLPPLALAGLALAALVLSRTRYRDLLRPAAAVLVRAVLFMVLQGLIFALALQIISGSFVPLAMPLAILAWLIGFMTPGAPGGMGVREALLVTMLSASVAGGDALIAALVFRIITTAGDLVLFGAGRALFSADPVAAEAGRS